MACSRNSVITLALVAQIAVSVSAGQEKELAEQAIVHLKEKQDLVKPNFKLAPANNENTNITTVSSGKWASKGNDFCDVSEFELNDLADALQMATSKLSKSSGRKVVRSAAPFSTCAAIISKIINHANHMFNIIRESKKSDIDKFEATQAELAGELVQFNRIIDNLKKSHHHNDSAISENFNSKLAAFQVEVNELGSHYLDSFMKSPLADTIISAWAGRIQAGDTHQIKEFARLHLNTNTMENNLPKLIRNSFSNNLDNFNAVLLFISGLPGYSQCHVGYEVLLEEMKKFNDHHYSHEIIRLAYKVKATMLMSNFPLLSEDIRSKYDILKKSFPTSITNFVWNGNNCTVKNAMYSESLYASGNHYNNESRRVFTMEIGHQIPRDHQWTFETRDDGISFRMRNALHNEYMFAGANYSTKATKRWVFSGIEGKQVYQGYWKITPVDSSAFTIMNTWYGQYLFAEDKYHGYDKRYVFTWRARDPYRRRWEESKWNLECTSPQ